MIHVFTPMCECVSVCMSSLKDGAYPPPPPHAWLLGSHISAAVCSKNMQQVSNIKIEHHDSIVYSKHEPILTYLAGATSDLTVGNTTQEPLDLPA